MALIVLAYVAWLSPAQPPADGDPAALTRMILSSDREMRRKGLAHVQAEREARIRVCDKLAEVIAQTKQDDDFFAPRNIALFALAESVDYSASDNVISALVNNSDTFFPGVLARTHLGTVDEDYPAVRGLMRVGNRAAPAVIKKLRSTDSTRAQKNLGYWLYKQYGRRLAIVQMNDIIDSDRSMPLDERKRIVAVLEYLEEKAK